MFWEAFQGGELNLEYLHNPQRHNSYSGNNPINLVDTDGRWWDTAVDLTVSVSGYLYGGVTGDKYLQEGAVNMMKDTLKDAVNPVNYVTKKAGEAVKIDKFAVKEIKVVQKVGKVSDKIADTVFKYTNKDFKKIAESLGLKETKKYGLSNGEKIYTKGSKYYSADNTSHNGGVWKVFEEKGGKLERIGTANKDLKIFKK